MYVISSNSFATTDEGNNSTGGIYIDELNRKFVINGNGQENLQLFNTISEDCTPVETVTDGITVTHCGWRDYDHNGGKWRAKAWTTAIKNDVHQYHYTRARVVHAIFGNTIYDSERKWGYSKTTAQTDYVKASEPLFSMRTNWGFKE
ncbi:hypothetical protein [Paenibacillus apiarius]|uniref:hypothetical protein n=1 Tax=Paenibacillus apiarius TaxID=46240 RepID=UPI00197E78BC|nr:hypothetical protein [Paenibacillus apiarius]MBN3525195.1 hypothetical protein [Paenibacillus apiarius]